jgi:hypothetical protein
MFKGFLVAIVLFIANNACARFENMPKDTSGYRGFYSTGPASTYKPAVMPEDVTYTPAVMPQNYVEEGSVPVTSIDLIKNGVLGQAYAMKVNEMLGSADGKFKRELTNKLDVAIRSRYRSEQDRVANLKDIIDREYTKFSSR